MVVSPETARFDELVRAKVEDAEVTLLLGDAFLSDLVETAPVSPRPLHVVRQVKTRNRILKKVIRYMRDDPPVDLEGAVEKVTDYAGGRILVHYVDDVSAIHTHLGSVVHDRTDVRLKGERCDRTHRAKDSGFRGCQQVLEFKIGPIKWFPFELQTLTFLQHDWDQKHHAIYEDPDDVPENVQVLYKQLSDDLYEADKTFQRIRPLVDSFLVERRARDPLGHSSSPLA